MRRLALVLLLALVPAPAPALPPGDLYVDATAASGLDFRHWNGMTGRLYISEILGPGAAFLDYDGDGDLDVVAVQGALLDPGETPLEPPPARPGARLFRNDAGAAGDGLLPRFVDVTAASGLEVDGYGMGVAVGDVDDDGFPDLLFTQLGGVELWHNRGDGTFADVTAAAGVAGDGFATAATFFDYDRDGRLDLFVARYVAYGPALHKVCGAESSAPDYCGPQSFAPERDRLWHNRGVDAAGRPVFADVTLEAGLGRGDGAGLGAVVTDFDGDGWLDLYVANDGTENQLWHNLGASGRAGFEDVAALAGCAVDLGGQAEGSMGVDAGDLDGDGDEELIAVHLDAETNTLYRNSGDGFYEDVTLAAGLAQPSLGVTSFGAGFLDFDLDGDLDLFVTNGAVHRLAAQAAARDPLPLRQRAQLFANAGDGRFADVSGRAGAYFAAPEIGRGAAVGDVDDDGDPDLLVAHNNGPLRLLLRAGRPVHHWLGLRLRTGRRDALGARLRLERPGRPPQRRRVKADGSYLSASDPRVVVGLGGDDGPVDAVVDWVSGRRERFVGLAVDRYVTLREGEGEPVAPGPSSEVPADSGEVPGDPRGVPGDSQAGVPGDPGEVPRDSARADPGGVPGDSARVPGDSEAGVPGDPGEVPRDSGAVPADPGEVPRDSGGVPADPGEVPVPDLADLEPAVREQLAAAHGELARRRADGATAPAALAAAYGRVGELHHVYRLPGTLVLYRAASRLAPDAFRWRYLAGLYALQSQELDAAVDELQLALALAPGDVPARLRLAEARVERGDLTAAAALLDTLLATDPALAPALALRARAAAASGDHTRAVDLYRRALELQPGAGRLRLALAASCRAVGDRACAGEQLRQRGDGNVVIADPLAAEVAARNLSSQHFQEVGDQALAQGRFTDALRAFERAAALAPANPDAQVNLAAAEAAAGRAAAAVARLERVLARSPHHANAHFNLGVLRAQAGDDEAALAHYRAALAVQPGLFAAQLNLANLLRRRGAVAEAADHYRRAVALEPARPDLRVALVRALWSAGDLDGAQDAAEAAYRDLPDAAPPREALARLLATHPDPAARDGRRALTLAEAAFAGERTFATVEALAMAHAAAGDFDQARRWQEAALDVARRAGQLAGQPQLAENLARYLRGEPAAAPWQ